MFKPIPTLPKVEAIMIAEIFTGSSEFGATEIHSNVGMLADIYRDNTKHFHIYERWSELPMSVINNAILSTLRTC